MKFEPHAETLNVKPYVTNTAKSDELSNQDKARSIIQLRSNGLSFKSLAPAFGVSRQRLKQI